MQNARLFHLSKDKITLAEHSHPEIGKTKDTKVYEIRMTDDKANSNSRTLTTW